MNDKIGVGFALNRIDASYYQIGRFDDSLKFNLLSIEIIDEENIYAVYYNRGITLRKIKEFAQSLTFFNKALRWAIERKDIESECFIYGQLALTYHRSGNYDKSLEFYKRCKTLSVKVENSKLELNCLIKALDIRETLSVQQQNPSLAPAKSEYAEVFNVLLS